MMKKDKQKDNNRLKKFFSLLIFELITLRFEFVNEDLTVSGLGLGLYISKQIVEAHKEATKVESVIGKGSVFTAIFCYITMLN